MTELAYIAWLLLVVLLLVLVWFDGKERGMETEADWWKQDAVERGAAEWQINPQTGEKRFVWKGRE